MRKGQTLRTNLHYHPNGTPQTDRTRIGLYFGKGELKKEVVAALAGNVHVLDSAERAEPRAARASTSSIRTSTSCRSSRTCICAGKDMTMTATYPDGRQETLLNVPAYDFSWQLFYYPKTRVKLPQRHARRPGRALRQLGGEQEQSGSDQAGDASARRRPPEMMFGMFEFTADAGVSPKPSTAARADGSARRHVPA